MTIVEERPDSSDAAALIEELETHLADRYPSESRHGFSVEKLLHEGVAFFVVRYEAAPAGCGGVKLFEDYGELKRMYVRPDYRGRGLGRALLGRLSDHTRQRGVGLLRLETGIYQAQAIALYERFGFARRGPFGDYREDPLSLFFEKRLS